MNCVVRYSIAQKSGGSHEDDETPLYSLAIQHEKEGSETLIREVKFEAAAEIARNHAKHNGYSTYLLNGRICTV
jgi:hypothetical protein